MLLENVSVLQTGYPGKKCTTGKISPRVLASLSLSTRAGAPSSSLAASIGMWLSSKDMLSMPTAEESFEAFRAEAAADGHAELSDEDHAWATS